MDAPSVVKSEKERVLDAKMEEMRRKNEELRRRHEVIFR